MRIVHDPGGVRVGAATTELRRTSQGELRLTFVYDVPGSVHAVVQIALDGRDLMPIAETHSSGGGDSTRVTFQHDRAVVTRFRGGREAGSHSTPLPPGTVTSAAIDLVFRALPLAQGFYTELPVYYEGPDRVVTMPIRVVGTEAVQTTSGRRSDCWIIEAQFLGPVERFWISRDTRELMRVVGHVSPTTIERFER